jgi:hypothetical protein
VPAWEVYCESKHGNIYQSKQAEWNWDAVPWQVGRDFGAPTCATCHNSLITDANGAVLASRTHDFGARLWVRLYGLPYAHAQPKQGRTAQIKNQEGLTLPVSFSGEPVAAALIDREEQAGRRSRMIHLCQACHSQSWATEFFAKLDQTTAEADQLVLASTRLMQQAWDKGWADRRRLFDEPLEQRWLRQWFFYANSLRLASAMSGPQYATFRHGWFELVNNLKEMEAWMETRKSSKEKE